MQVKKVHGVEQTSPIETNDQSCIYLLAIDQLKELFRLREQEIFETRVSVIKPLLSDPAKCVKDKIKL